MGAITCCRVVFTYYASVRPVDGVGGIMSMGCPSVCACVFSNRLAVDFLIKLLPPYVRLSVRLSVPWRSCLGYRHAGCLQLSHRRPAEMCGLRTRPRTDVDPPRFLPPSNCHRRGGNIVSPIQGRYLVLCVSLLGVRNVFSHADMIYTV